jgi:L-2-hydroxyglutarate oxidase LhgO
MANRADILICGGGIIGLTIAGKLLKKGYENIVILEKEEEIGKHASGRNSGVLHAGIYYSRDSLKAKLCLKGNRMMKDYCGRKNIPVFETGKVIVAKNERETAVLNELYKRALNNGAKVELIDNKRLKSIEPFARTLKYALFSPETAVVDPQKILNSIEEELTGSGKVKILKDSEFRGIESNREVVTNKGNIRFDLFVNAAGAFSDRIAHIFSTGLNYKILPFTGTYRKLAKEKTFLVKGNIYPVPDVRHPFLGVHFTKAVNGAVYIGPTAIPALGREHYELLKGIDKELFEIVYREGVLFFKNPGFRKIAVSEPKKYLLKYFFNEVKDMLDNLKIEDIQPGNKTGIRPQLVDWKKKELVMDFVVLKHETSIHILNAVSPAFTSSMAFAEFVVEKHLS